MKKIIFVLLSAAILFWINSYAQKSDGIRLAPEDFSQLINKNPGAAIVDVRTPDEFAKGHLPNAINVEWKQEVFMLIIAMLDKSKPVFVYCLGGSRSAAAASQMRKDGFNEVYELKGGILKWRAASLPEVHPSYTIAVGI